MERNARSQARFGTVKLTANTSTLGVNANTAVVIIMALCTRSKRLQQTI